MRKRVERRGGRKESEWRVKYRGEDRGKVMVERWRG
jgi:hypothetical protein